MNNENKSKRRNLNTVNNISQKNKCEFNCGHFTWLYSLRWVWDAPHASSSFQFQLIIYDGQEIENAYKFNSFDDDDFIMYLYKDYRQMVCAVLLTHNNLSNVYGMKSNHEREEEKRNKYFLKLLLHIMQHEQQKYYVPFCFDLISKRKFSFLENSKLD